MLTYSIKARSLFHDVADRLVSRFAHTDQRHFTHTPHIGGNEAICQLTKYEYTAWIEKVKAEWKVGDLVCLRQIPIMPNTVPVYYEITYINELHLTVRYDIDINEPIALTCRTTANAYINKCPAVLRHLSPEETALVRLSNTKTIGSA